MRPFYENQTKRNATYHPSVFPYISFLLLLLAFISFFMLAFIPYFMLYLDTLLTHHVSKYDSVSITYAKVFLENNPAKYVYVLSYLWFQEIILFALVALSSFISLLWNVIRAHLFAHFYFLQKLSFRYGYIFQRHLSTVINTAES